MAITPPDKDTRDANLDELKKAVDDSVKKISRKDPEKEIKKLAADIAALKREVPGRDVNAVTRYDLKQLSDKLDKTEGSLRRTSETLRDLERTVENGGAESSRGLADAKRDIRSAKREIDRLEGRVRDVESRTRR